MTADEEDDLRGTGDIPIDENGYIIGPSVPVRYRQDFYDNARPSRLRGSVACADIQWRLR